MIKLQDIVERVFCFFWNSFHAKFQGKENVGGLWPHSPATCKISGMQQTHTITSASAVVGFYKKFVVVSCAQQHCVIRRNRVKSNYHFNPVGGWVRRSVTVFSWEPLNIFSLNFTQN